MENTISKKFDYTKASTKECFNHMGEKMFKGLMVGALAGLVAGSVVLPAAGLGFAATIAGTTYSGLFTSAVAGSFIGGAYGTLISALNECGKAVMGEIKNFFENRRAKRLATRSDNSAVHNNIRAQSHSQSNVQAQSRGQAPKTTSVRHTLHTNQSSVRAKTPNVITPTGNNPFVKPPKLPWNKQTQVDWSGIVAGTSPRNNNTSVKEPDRPKGSTRPPSAAGRIDKIR